MRSLILIFAATAAVSVAFVSAAHAQTSTDAPVACVALSKAPPAKLLESCAAVIGNSATPEADRLDAMITHGVALAGSGQIDQGLAEIADVIAKNPQSARAFRARGEILRRNRQFDAAYLAF